MPVDKYTECSHDYIMFTELQSLRDIPASPALLNAVRGRFIIQGTSLARWCRENNVDRVWASDALLGKRNGPKAIELRNRLVAVVEQR